MDRLSPGPDVPMVRHLGTATLLLDVGGRTIVTDPVLDPAGTTFVLGRSPLSGEISYRNLVGAQGARALPSRPDLVLLSHDQHRDNLDRGGLELVRRARMVLTTRPGAERLRRRGVANVRGLAPWERCALPGLVVTAVPARHGPWGTNWLAGEVVGFVLESSALRLGPVYITGDTRLFSGALEVGARFERMGTVFAHVGAARFGTSALRHLLRFSMDAVEVCTLARHLQPRQLVPIHYEGWSHFSEGRAELELALERVPSLTQTRFLPVGDRVELEPEIAQGASI
ncbi:MAG: MBL fold metallo-hydrolase [Polyangiaceae bacterium]|nr:MBL fold metallo-hydrolase [Polyangiaceae bacterium]